MVIIKDVKTIFIHVQRTGGSSIIQLFHKYFQYRMRYTPQHGNYLTEDARFIEKHPDFLIFGFVRNPWERMLSWYSLTYKASPLPLEQEKIRFEEFLVNFDKMIEGDDSFHFNQLDYFPNPNEVPNEVCICRYENFQAETEKIFKRFGITISEVDRSNNTKPKNYRDYYTEVGKKIVEENCARDIEHFHYSY